MTQPLGLIVRPSVGGIRTHVQSLLRLLNRDRWEVTVLAPVPFLASLEPCAQTYDTYDLPIPARLGLQDLAVAKQLAEYARTHGGLFHAHGLRSAWIAALAQRRHPFPFVVTLHNVPSSGTPTRLLLNHISRRARCIIGVSYAVLKPLQTTGPRVIAGGVDLEEFKSMDRIAARKSMGLSENEFVVVSVARLSPEKGMDTLLAAARLLPDITFLIAGDGPQRRRLEMQSGPNVRMLGRVAISAPLFACADIVAAPSRTEGQGLAAIEAMASGVPVVATRVGGLAETVKNGNTGLLVAPNDPQELAHSLRRLQKDPVMALRLGAAGQAWATQNADVRMMVSQIEGVYNSAFAP